MMEDGWKHLYGVIEAPQNLNLSAIGFGNRRDEVYPITHDRISAIVRNTSLIDYKTMAKDVVLRYLLDHQKVVEKAMESHPIIPFKFGSLACTEKEVRQILVRGYGLFKSLLPWVGERVEVELVAMWDGERVFKTLYDEEFEIRSLQERIEKKSAGEAFLEKIELGRWVRQCLIKRRYQSKERILSQLRGCTESYCDHDVMDDLMILNTAFLLRKGMESEFDSRVQYLDQAFRGEVSLKIVGPLPLYSFRCIEIEWVNADELRSALGFLGLNEYASLADVRNAYYSKAQATHPDKTENLLNSSSEFEKVVNAYRLLNRCYRAYQCLPRKERILLMEVRSDGSNEGGF